MRKPLLLLLLCGMLILPLSHCAPDGAEQVSFAHDVRPILKTRCMSCHGGVRQLGGLSYLFEEDMYQPLRSGKIAVVPGDPDRSEMMHRITTDREGMMMPPEGDRLTDGERDIIRRWIEQGAKWEPHWSYVPPVQSTPPPVAGHPIDAFVRAALPTHQLTPSPRAEPADRFRRVHFDLTGLPPSPEATRAFVADPSPEAYERTVDDLLASPHYGEHWAAFWLDLARYADSQGYQKDHIRLTMYLYRDWVIEAFNNDMPLDSFTIRQLAGDLLAEPTEQDLLATAFHRNTMTNDEGGTDNEEFRVKAVLDRVNVTMEVWQGATFSCVQCHSHPYDPVRHEEYYALKGYFNNTKDADLTSDYPRIPLQSAAQLRKLETWHKLLEEEALSQVQREKIQAMIAALPVPEVPVMQELPDSSARTNRLFIRGNWLMEADTLTPGVPRTYDKTGKTFAPNRLGLAEWLVDEGNPLTGRVLVNRIWARVFGRGIVGTVEDLGIQGETPTHPELLDWLAVEFTQRHDWRLKPLLRSIVLSETYQQTSVADSVSLKIDPENRWLGRGPRFRLSAEELRDQALAVSGLLNDEVYGPSVMPYQPAGVWNVIRQVARWRTSTNGNNHRRALYTFYRRVSPYPTMLLFDAPSRELCVSRRVRTNTPLQAMVTLNDPVFVEAAAALAQRVTDKAPETTAQQVRLAFEYATCHPPSSFQENRLLKLYANNLAAYVESPHPEDKPAPLAALETVCQAVLNLDQVLVKH